MNQADDQTPIRRDSWLIVALGFVQGVAVFGLSEVRSDDWLALHSWLYAALWGWAVFLPPTAQWLIAHRRHKGYWLLLGLVALLAPALGGYAASIEMDRDFDTTGPALLVGGALAWAVVISLASTTFASEAGPRDYPTLFRLTCRTVLLPLGALLFTLIFTLLLWLWGALFDLIAIDFFKRLFRFDWFAWPVRGIVFGVATAILIERPALIDGVRRAATAIASALLPVVVVIHLVFFVGLLIVGLEPLWATRHATPLILTLLIVFFLLLNGAHEEGSKLDCLLKPIAGLTRLAILLSPIYIAIAGYSLALRVGQYGWSPDRVISACAIGFVGSAVLAYVIAGLRRPFLALPHLGWANLAAMAVLLILALAVNSPILAPTRIAAISQEARILAGRIAPVQRDWIVLAFDLGRYGRDALKRLTVVKDVADAEDIRDKAAKALAAENRYALRENDRARAENFVMVPGNTPPPANLLDLFRTDLRSTIPPHCEVGCKLLAIDLNGDGEQEIVLLAGSLPVYRHESGRWSRIGEMAESGAAKDRSAMIEKITNGMARTVSSDWLDLDVDGERLTFRPNR